MATRALRMWGRFLIPSVLTLCALSSSATIPGITGPNFNLAVKSGYIETPDGNSIFTWGYADLNGGGTMQYPGPTLIVNQGDVVTVTLTDFISEPVSIVFPGQTGVVATGGLIGLLTHEAPPDGTTTVTYTFTADHAGTYTYYSGTRPELQVEMGMVGALIVRPTGFDPNVKENRRAYNDPASQYDYEYLYLLTEMDPTIHEKVEFGQMSQIDNTAFWPVNWFINGRCGPDTMQDPNVPYLPNQPYNCQPRTRPGEKVLLRVIGAGRDFHPLHHHGNNSWTIAKDGRMLESQPGVSGPDLAVSNYTIASAPGETEDAIWVWTGYKLGWDAYGHQLGVVESDPNRRFQALEINAQSTLAGSIGPSTTTITVPAGEGARFTARFRAILWSPIAANPDLDPNREVVQVVKTGTDTFSVIRAREGTAAGSWPAGTIFADTDHGVLPPVTLPSIENLTFGPWASGSPYLGGSGALPPGEGGFNRFGGYYFMWHSHDEKELTNNNIFPGGMMSMMALEPPGTPIP